MPSPLEMSTTNGASTYLGSVACMPSFRIGSSFETSNIYEFVILRLSDTEVSAV
ncbi:hypothetical protein Syun_009374 [Stephania yunnanensis]|uniref:Uncharacterized protein n=1 Tax=Stephania yunnanensis TaxID=152371 RepID=A0AAP0KH06_9MAGN